MFFGFLGSLITIFIFSYYYLNIFGGYSNSRGIDPALNNLIAVQTQQVLISGVNTIKAPFLRLYSSVVQFIQLIIQQLRWTILIVFIIIFALAIHYDHPTFVLNLDYAWRCTIYMAFWTFIAPLLQIIRLVYAVLAPLLNMFAIIYFQIIQATWVMFFKCSVNSIFEPVEPLARAIIDFVLSFISWFGLDDLPLSSENNWVVIRPPSPSRSANPEQRFLK